MFADGGFFEDLNHERSGRSAELHFLMEARKVRKVSCKALGPRDAVRMIDVIPYDQPWSTDHATAEDDISHFHDFFAVDERPDKEGMECIIVAKFRHYYPSNAFHCVYGSKGIIASRAFSFVGRN